METKTKTEPTKLETLRTKKSEIIKGYKAALKFVPEITRPALKEDACKQLAAVLLEIVDAGGEMS